MDDLTLEGFGKSFRLLSSHQKFIQIIDTILNHRLLHFTINPIGPLEAL